MGFHGASEGREKRKGGAGERRRDRNRGEKGGGGVRDGRRERKGKVEGVYPPIPPSDYLHLYIYIYRAL